MSKEEYKTKYRVVETDSGFFVQGSYQVRTNTSLMQYLREKPVLEERWMLLSLSGQGLRPFQIHPVAIYPTLNEATEKAKMFASPKFIIHNVVSE